MLALYEHLLKGLSTHTNRDWRELLPLPRLPLICEGDIVNEKCADVMQVARSHVVTKCDWHVLSWPVAVANGINAYYGEGLVQGELTSGQWTCVKLGISYTGEVLDFGELLNLTRVEPGLPPFEHCGAVESVALAEGPIRDYLLHPEKGGDLELFKGLLARKLIGVVEESACLRIRGEVLVICLLGVAKPNTCVRDSAGQSLGPVQRLIMNLTASNDIVLPCPADIEALPTMAAWRSIVVPPECDLELSWEDGAFYLMALPTAWCKYFTFNVRWSSTDLGLPGPSSQVRVGSRVIPMGWKNAVGLCQYLHRRIVSLCEKRPKQMHLRQPLPLEREARKDKVFLLLVGGHAEASKSWQALWHLYIDDVDLRELIPRGGSAVITPAWQTNLRGRYEMWSAARSADKACEQQSSAKRLGYWIDGIAGKLGIGGERAGKLIGISMHLLQRSTLCKRDVQILSGLWAHETAAVLQKWWQQTAHWEQSLTPLSPVMASELCTLVLHLPLLQVDLRAPLPASVIATDASETGGGVCEGINVTPEGRRHLLNEVRGVLGLGRDRLCLIAVADELGRSRRALESIGIEAAVSIRWPRSQWGAAVIQL
eukprot:6491633-Amphidinium_carterae.1